MKRLLFGLLAVLCASSAISGDVVKEFFPWLEIGQVMDEAKEKELGLRHLYSHEASPDFRAHSLYAFKCCTGFPTNHCAFVTISLPERKVLAQRHDIECASTNEMKKLESELIGKVRPLECKGGKRTIEVTTASDATVCVMLSDAGFAKEVKAYLSKCDSE